MSWQAYSEAPWSPPQSTKVAVAVNPNRFVSFTAAAVRRYSIHSAKAARLYVSDDKRSIKIDFFSEYGDGLVRVITSKNKAGQVTRTGLNLNRFLRSLGYDYEQRIEIDIEENKDGDLIVHLPSYCFVEGSDVRRGNSNKDR